MVKEKKIQEVKIVHVKSNDLVDKIVNDYPKNLIAYPRGLFETQLKQHLLKHKIGVKK